VSFRPELRALSDEQVYEIHQAALEILWNTGVLVKENNVHASTRGLHYEPMIGRLNCYDHTTGAARRTTLEDVNANRAHPRDQAALERPLSLRVVKSQLWRDSRHPLRLDLASAWAKAKSGRWQPP
jgi:hypothetical protein